MRLNIKRKLIWAGMVLFTGVMAISSQVAAYTYISFSTGDNLVTAHGNGNINSSVFTYGGSRTGSYDNKYVVARMSVDRAWYGKCYENGRALLRVAFSEKHNAGKKDQEGIKIVLKTYDSNGTTQRSIAMRTISCK